MPRVAKGVNPGLARLLAIELILYITVTVALSIRGCGPTHTLAVSGVTETIARLC